MRQTMASVSSVALLRWSQVMCSSVPWKPAPNAMMGRVMSIYTLSIAGIIPLGSLLAGGGAAVIGADSYQMLSGAVLGLAAVWGFFTQRELRALD